MFKWLRNWIELFKLNRKERALDKEGERKRVEAREKKDESILEEWDNNYGHFVYEDIRWSRKKLVSDALMREADELHLPRPQYADKAKWEDELDEYDRPRGLVLTPESITELRSTIRKEKNERRERWVKFVPIITGLVGASIGLVVVIRQTPTKSKPEPESIEQRQAIFNKKVACKREEEKLRGNLVKDKFKTEAVYRVFYSPKLDSCVLAKFTFYPNNHKRSGGADETAELVDILIQHQLWSESYVAAKPYPEVRAELEKQIKTLELEQ